MAKRILYICSGRNFKASALGPKVSGVVNTWGKSGNDVVLVCGGDLDAEKTDGAIDYGAQGHHNQWFRRVKLFSPIVNSLSEWRDIEHDKKMYCYLKGTIESWKPDLIWERSSRLHSSGLKLSRELGVPCVLEWKDHLIPYKFSLFRSRAVAVEREKNQDSDFIVVESGVLKEQLSLENQLDEEKFLVAYNATDSTKFDLSKPNRSAVRNSLSLSQDDILVGYLGSYAFYHDAERLVHAAGLFSQRGHSKVKFVMVGNGKNFLKCKALAETLGVLGNNLILKPGVPSSEVPAILESLDIAVLPGSTEIICPIKVQEYMAAGLPVVVPDYPCNREVIDNNVNGFLFKPFDENSLSDCIEMLVGDEPLRRRIADRASTDVKERFTWEKTWGAALNRALEETV